MTSLSVTFAILMLACAVSGTFYPYHQPLSQEIIDYVNHKANTTWKVRTRLAKRHLICMHLTWVQTGLRHHGHGEEEI